MNASDAAARSFCFEAREDRRAPDCGGRASTGRTSRGITSVCAHEIGASGIALPLLISRYTHETIPRILFRLQEEIQAVVAERIKAIRKKKGISQDELAELAGLNRVHLFRIERGRCNPTLRTLKIIADTLGVKVRDLIGDV